MKLFLPVLLITTSLVLQCCTCIGQSTTETSAEGTHGSGQPAESVDGTPDMWGNLKGGPYSVGFRTVFASDRSRPAIPYSDWDGRLHGVPDADGRQMQINLWYPAVVEDKDDQIRFQHYVELMARQTDFGDLDQQKGDFADRQFVTKTRALGGDECAFSMEDLQRLKKLKTNAYNDAPPIDGKFPLIVFPNGNSPAIQSIFCEYFQAMASS